MLLNLGLAADAAAAHSSELASHAESSPASTSPCPSPFSLPALPFLGTLYSKQLGGPAAPAASAASIAAVAMSPILSTPTEGQSSIAAVSPTSTLARPRATRSSTNKKPLRSKTAYQFAHPASHAHHKRLRLRPKLLLQVQQASQTPRPIPVIDVLPSTMYLPRLARKFPALFRRRNGLCPYDVIIVRSELYEASRANVPEKQTSSEDDEEDHREVVATICQMLPDDARQKGKAEICLNFGPVWEATPLATGSYEFVAHTDDGVRVMRWALRTGKNRRGAVPSGTQARDELKRFTFSVIDPNSRRHPVLASMTRNQLEVHDEYSPAIARSTPGPATPSSGMSVASDMSDAESPVETKDMIALSDELRTLIIVTGIWVAFREGWSHNFSYADAASAPNGKGLVSPTSSAKYSSPTSTKLESDKASDRDEVSPVKEFVNGKRCMSFSSMKRANSMAPTEGKKGLGSLSRRSNSTGAAFMNRANQRSASAASSRRNRHSMFPGTGENGRDIVISRPSSPRNNALAPEKPPQTVGRPVARPNVKSGLPNLKTTLRPDRGPELTLDSAPELPSKDNFASKTKRRQRLSSLFTLFHRKH